MKTDEQTKHRNKVKQYINGTLEKYFNQCWQETKKLIEDEIPSIYTFDVWLQSIEEKILGFLQLLFIDFN